jgi:hypothetical protein
MELYHDILMNLAVAKFNQNPSSVRAGGKLLGLSVN